MERILEMDLLLHTACRDDWRSDVSVLVLMETSPRAASHGRGIDANFTVATCKQMKLFQIAGSEASS